MTFCGLCQKEAVLQRSHIIPAFVFRWLRETSATGYLRYGMNPHKRAQDGLKTPMLCADCEQGFSRLERQFANDIFYPIQRHKVEEVVYGSWFLKFCVSISWRILTYLIQQDGLSHFSTKQQREASAALERWSEFLVDKVKDPGRFEQRLTFLGAIESVSSPGLPPNANRYFMRGTEIDIAASETSAFTYAKFGPFALFGMIEAGEHWRGAEIKANEGTVGPKHYELPHSILDYWVDRARRHEVIYREISQGQQDKLEASILKNPERFLNSGTFEAMARDVNIFGDSALWKRKDNDTEGD